MKKTELARRIAKESGITTAAAADQVDRVVTELLDRVRQGKSISFPGLGIFKPIRNQGFTFEREAPPRPANVKKKDSK